jgi:hypothetical protein
VHYVFGKINYGGLKHNSLYLGLDCHLVVDRASLTDDNFFAVTGRFRTLALSVVVERYTIELLLLPTAVFPATTTKIAFFADEKAADYASVNAS